MNKLQANDESQRTYRHGLREPKSFSLRALGCAESILTLG
jgi:hypothetical protein